MNTIIEVNKACVKLLLTCSYLYFLILFRIILIHIILISNNSCSDGQDSKQALSDDDLCSYFPHIEWDTWVLNSIIYKQLYCLYHEIQCQQYFQYQFKRSFVNLKEVHILIGVSIILSKLIAKYFYIYIPLLSSFVLELILTKISFCNFNGNK